MTRQKTNAGNFFEDFRLGQVIRHATPRTLTAADAALYTALYGSRFAVQSSDAFARAIGYPESPLDDLLVFHVVFGKTVPDVSLNAVANLGYAGMQFLAPVHAGDTLSATSPTVMVRGVAWRMVWPRRKSSKKLPALVLVMTTLSNNCIPALTL